MRLFEFTQTLAESDNPVTNAITRRILLQRTDLLSKYGPVAVTQAIDEVSDFVGDVDEIGSSDVSGWIKHVEQMLGNMGEQGVAEASGYDGSEPLDLSTNPSVNDVFKRALYIYDYEGYGNDMDYSEDEAIEQYVAQKFGQDVLDQLNKAKNQQYFGRADGKGPGGGGRTSNLGTSSAPGGNFRTTKAGKMHGQDAKMMKARVADRLGRHPAPNLPEGYYDLNDEGMQPIDLSTNPSFKQLVNRYTQLFYQGHEGSYDEEESAESDAIEQYVAKRFGQKGSDHLLQAAQASYGGRSDGRGMGGSRGSNLGRPNQPGGNFRTTKAGVMNKQDAKTMKGKIANRLGRHPAPNLPEAGYYNPLDQERREQDQMDYNKRAFKRAEMQHELGHEDDPDFERKQRQQAMDRDRGPWYVRIDGKIYRQGGQPKSFDWKKGANNYALAMLKNNPSLQGKILLSKNSEDK